MTQLEAALLRLVLLGLITWGSLRQPADLRDAVIEGTATHPVVKEAQAMGGTRAVRVFTG